MSPAGVDVELRSLADVLLRRNCSLARRNGEQLDEILRQADALAAIGAHDLAGSMRAGAVERFAWLLGGRTSD